MHILTCSCNNFPEAMPDDELLNATALESPPVIGYTALNVSGSLRLKLD